MADVYCIQSGNHAISSLQAVASSPLLSLFVAAENVEGAVSASHLQCKRDAIYNTMLVGVWLLRNWPRFCGERSTVHAEVPDFIQIL